MSRTCKPYFHNRPMAAKPTIFRYDLAGPTPRVILITDHDGKRSDVPRLGYVVLPRR